jgi:hypothetical protein
VKREERKRIERKKKGRRGAFPLLCIHHDGFIVLSETNKAQLVYLSKIQPH